MQEPYIKLYKKMLRWEWYDDINTFRLFLHCLLRANWESGSWHGIHYEPGQFITSLQTLANETHLTVKQVRTALDHLKETNEVADLRQSNYRIITVVKWNEYQCKGKPNGKLGADQGQTEGKPRATDKEYKEYKEYKEGEEIKHIYGEYKHVRLTDKERDRLFNDYGEQETLKAITYLDEYKQRKGYTSKDDNLTLRKWVFDALKRESQGQKQKDTQSLAEKWGVKA